MRLVLQPDATVVPGSVCIAPASERVCWAGPAASAAAGQRLVLHWGPGICCRWVWLLVGVDLQTDSLTSTCIRILAAGRCAGYCRCVLRTCSPGWGRAAGFTAVTSCHASLHERCTLGMRPIAAGMHIIYGLGGILTQAVAHRPCRHSTSAAYRVIP